MGDAGKKQPQITKKATEEKSIYRDGSITQYFLYSATYLNFLSLSAAPPRGWVTHYLQVGRLSDSLPGGWVTQYFEVEWLIT